MSILSHIVNWASVSEVKETTHKTILYSCSTILLCHPISIQHKHTSPPPLLFLHFQLGIQLQCVVMARNKLKKDHYHNVGPADFHQNDMNLRYSSRDFSHVSSLLFGATVGRERTNHSSWLLNGDVLTIP